MQNQIILSAICYSGLLLLLYANRSNDQKLINEKGKLKKAPVQVVAYQFICFIWLSAFTLLLINFHPIHLFSEYEPRPVAIIVLLVTYLIISLITSISASRTGINLNYPPQIIPASVLLSYIITRTLFLIVYEFFIRGIVLTILIDFTHSWTSIVLNTILYTLLHAFASKKEIFGTLLFGPILCILTIQFQALWPAITLHLLLAGIHEGLQLHYHSKFLKQAI
jgi:membrane protease YdiL (CAAX protease family)